MDDKEAREGDVARPGLAPASPPAGPATTIHVDGEVFSVTSSEQPNTSDYVWVSGPNPGYGFGMSGPVADPTLEEHRVLIRGFLATVDPRTGYIEDE